MGGDANELKGGRKETDSFFTALKSYLHVFRNEKKKKDEPHGGLTAVNCNPLHYPALTLHHLPNMCC